MSEGLVLAGRYRLIQRLGGGAMGSVWRAEDMKLRAPVAVKLMDPSIAETSEAVARFRREAQAAAAIRSTYVVQILDHGVDGNTPYIAMELLTGESLAVRLERVGRLTPEKTIAVLAQVARALELAHAKGIVHRDLKPENVFLVREGSEDVAKVLDFGIARRMDDLGATGGLQTRSGTVLGTPFYMSPEQSIGQPVDPRSDIWSFGVIAFECITGKRPFESETLGGLFHAICVAPLPTPSKVATVPPGFDEWFRRVVARDCSDRPPSIEEAVSQLRVVCGGSGSVRIEADTLQPSLATATRDLAMAETVGPASVTIHGRPRLAGRRLWLVLALPLAALTTAIVVWFRESPAGDPPAPSLPPVERALPSNIASLAAASASAPVTTNAVPSVSASSAVEAVPVVPKSNAGGVSRTVKPRAPAAARRVSPGHSDDEFVGF